MTIIDLLYELDDICSSGQGEHILEDGFNIWEHVREPDSEESK